MPRPNSALIEPRFKFSIDRWAKDHVPVGGFLRAVLENDLRESIGRADESSLENLVHIVAYLYNEVDLRCWGSPAKVQEWEDTRADTT